MPCRATQDRRVMVESSDKTWSTGEGNGKPLQYSFLENPMNSMKRGNTGGQYIREKMLNIAHYQRNPNQNYSEVSPHTGQNAIIKDSTNNTCWVGCEEKGTLLYAAGNVNWYSHY